LDKTVANPGENITLSGCYDEKPCLYKPRLEMAEGKRDIHHNYNGECMKLP